MPINQKVARHFKEQRFVFLLVSIAALCGLLFGFDTGIIASAILFVGKHFHLSTMMTETVVSAVLFGAIIGALVSGYFADRWGRRRLMHWTAALFVVGTVVCIAANQVGWLIAGRFVIGVAIGVASYVAPLYISEIAPARTRGSLVIVNTVTVTGGIVIAYMIGLTFADGGHWRWMMGVGLVPAALLWLGVMVLPYSPRWLVDQGRKKEALNLLSRMRGENHASQEWQLLCDTVKKKRMGYRQLLSGKLMKVLALGCGLAMVQQFTGINTLLYYAPTIFQSVGLQAMHAKLWATLGLGVTNCLMTVVAFWLVDRVGRRPLLLGGLFIMTICLLSVGALFKMHLTAVWVQDAYMALLMLYVASYALSIGCLFWLIISEIYPLAVRGSAMSLAASFNWFSNAIVAMTFLSLLTHWGTGNTFFLYGSLGALSVLGCYFFVPETRKASLEQIEGALLTGEKLRRLGEA